MCLRRRQFGPGFTLVEVLVVIAIITVLVSVLMPSLYRAREQAKSVRCLANLKDLGSAAQVYAAADADNHLIPIHWRTMAPLFQAAPGGTGGAFLLGDIQWGGKGGDPRLVNMEQGNATTYANVWAFTHAWDFGPADRPLNRLLFRSVVNGPWPELAAPPGSDDLGNAAAVQAAVVDSEVEMEIFHCPSDTGWSAGRAGAAYLDSGYVRVDRGIGLEVPLYEFMGNSYKNSMNWIQVGEGANTTWFSTTAWGTPTDRVFSPSRLVLWAEGNAEDTAMWNRPELEDPRIGRPNIAEWWVQGWHQGGTDIQGFNTSFADGHAAVIEQQVRSAYTGYHPGGDGAEFSSGVTAMRGSRPEIITAPYGWGDANETHPGWWGDKLFRGEGWTLDNLPAPPRYVMPAY